MGAVEERAPQRARRGRPRTREQANGLVRRNLLVDPVALRQLCELYGTTSESEAVRRVIDMTLLIEQAHQIQEYMAAHGGAVDVYGPPPPLPVYLQPGDVVDVEDEDAL